MRIVFRVLMMAAVFAVVAARPAMAQGDAEKGKAVYAAQKCSMCHGIAGVGSKANPLDGVGKKLSAADIKAWIVTPVEAAAKAKSTKKPVMTDKYTASCRQPTSTRSSPTWPA